MLFFKLAAFIIGLIEAFQITSTDAIISLIGFSIMFVVDILKK
jgi:hypothetical protein